MRPRRPPTLSLKLKAMEVVKGNEVEKEEMEEANLEGVAKIRRGKKGRIGDFLTKLGWLLFEILWVKSHWWIWNKI